MALTSVQAEEVTKSVTFSNYTAGTQYANNEKHDLGDGLVIYTTKCHFTSELRIYSSSTNNGYVVSDALPGTITKMTFNAGNKADNLLVYGSNDGASWTKVGSITVKSTYADYTLNFTGEYKCFKLDVEGTNQIRLKSMSVTYTTTGEGGGETPDEPETPVVETVATPIFNLADGATFEDFLPVTISTATEGATIYYTLNGGAEKSGLSPVTLNVTETTEIVAYATKENYINSAEVTATYTKLAPVDPNAKEVEATISFASTTHRVSQDNNKQVWANEGVTFTNNKASSSNNVANFSNPVRLYAGSNIVIGCTSMTKILFVCNNSSYATTLKNSIGNAATASGSNVTVELASPVDIFTATLSGQVRLNSLTVTYVTTQKVVKSPVFTPESCGFYAGDVVEVTISAEEGTTIYYTLDGNDPTTSSAVYSESIIVSENTTVKAIAVVDDTASEVATAVYKKGVDGTVAEAFTAYVDGERLPAVVTGYIVGYVNGSSAGDAGENCVFDAEGCEVKTNILIANDPYETDYMKCLAVQLPNNDIRATLNLVDNAGNLNKKVVVKGSLEKYLGIAGLKEIVVGELVEEAWSSFFAGFPVAIPEGIEAYIITAVNGGYVILEQIYEAIPANTGVILKGGSIEASQDNYYTGNVTPVEVNLLKGTTNNSYIDEEAYVLSKVDGKVGFYKAKMNQNEGTAWLNNANKAYLPVSALPASLQGAASFSFRFEEGTTGIDEMTEQRAESKVIYDLTGRRVEAITTPGIYIVNGKKVLVK